MLSIVQIAATYHIKLFDLHNFIEAQEVKGNYIESDHIAFSGVSIVSPDKVMLLKNLNFSVKPGQNTLIVGPNGKYLDINTTTSSTSFFATKEMRIAF